MAVLQVSVSFTEVFSEGQLFINRRVEGFVLLPPARRQSTQPRLTSQPQRWSGARRAGNWKLLRRYQSREGCKIEARYHGYAKL